MRSRLRTQTKNFETQNGLTSPAYHECWESTGTARSDGQAVAFGHAGARGGPRPCLRVLHVFGVKEEVGVKDEFGRLMHPRALSRSALPDVKVEERSKKLRFN